MSIRGEAEPTTSRVIQDDDIQGGAGAVDSLANTLARGYFCLRVDILDIKRTSLDISRTMS